MLIGAIADDITGASDLALTFAREGLVTRQIIGQPQGAQALAGAEAVVVALKTRSIAPDAAITQSRAAAEALQGAGAERLYFKYCSTFDSTGRGNIGPVAEALMALTGCDITIACPAFPATGRTVYMGHLFVGDRLLSESPMKDHPLNPMRDSDLVRVLGRQSRAAVGLLGHAVVRRGASAIAEALAQARREGKALLIADAVTDADLEALGRATAGLALTTGGSGLGMGLARQLAGARRSRGAAAALRALDAPAGRAAILAGSCSAATRAQIDHARAAGLPCRALDPLELAEGRDSVEAALDWAAGLPTGAIPLIHSSAAPETLARVQARLGAEHAGALVEAALARIAAGLVAAGTRRLIVAGGETSGAVTAALGIHALDIGPEIAPGVPWTVSHAPHLALALKSGNFGGPDFFLRAWSLLTEPAAHV